MITMDEYSLFKPSSAVFSIVKRLGLIWRWNCAYQVLTIKKEVSHVDYSVPEDTDHGTHLATSYKAADIKEDRNE